MRMRSAVKIKTRAGLFCLLMAFLFLLPMPKILRAEDVKENIKTVLIKTIRITGNTVVSQDVLAPIVKPYEGRFLTLAELQKIASLVTDEYRKRGYVIARAYIPEQKVIDSAVTIDVVEGRVGEIKVQGDHKYYSDEFIKKHLEPVRNQVFRQDDLERAVLVLNEYPRLSVSAAMQAGADPGTTDITLTANNSVPIHLTLDYNNFGSSYVGTSRFGVTVDVGNVLVEGSVFSLRAVSGSDPNDLLFGRASYTVPVGVRGTRLGLYYANGDFDIGQEFAILDMSGRTESYGIYLTHPFIKKRTLVLTGEFGLDFKDTEQYVLGEISSDDRIRIVKAGLSCESSGLTGRTVASLYIAQGLGETLGGMANNEPFTSRVGADDRFTKVNLDAVRLQKLLPRLFLMMRGSGQWASDSLVASEQFTIGGADTVRGYPQGEYVGDDGYALTAELRLSPLADKESFQLALFVDNGGVSVKDTVPGQKKHHSLTGGGAGFRVDLPYDVNMRADVGFPLDPGDDEPSTNKATVYFQAVKRF